MAAAGNANAAIRIVGSLIFAHRASTQWMTRINRLFHSRSAEYSWLPVTRIKLQADKYPLLSYWLKLCAPAIK